MRIPTRDLLNGRDTGPAQTSGPIRGGARRGQFPLRTRAQAKDYLLADGGPDTLVVFEFSGGLLRALLDAGVSAFAVDKREPEHDGPSFQGDVRAIIDLKKWRAVYFVGPNCYQNMRYDACLSKKIDDGRAYWGAVMVLWCICCAYAEAFLVEQPDTNTHDYLDVESMPGVAVLEVRSVQLGDKRDKFFRFTTRGLDMGHALTHMEAASHTTAGPRPDHLAYASAEERDRARSTWGDLPKTCSWVANIPVYGTAGLRKLNYVDEVRKFADKWKAAGHPLPAGYDNPTAEPLDAAGRDYQLVRGDGDGRQADPKAPRRAEAGDQWITADVAVTFLLMVNRLVRTGAKANAAQRARYDGLAWSFGPLAGPKGPIFFWKEHVSEGPRGCLSNYFAYAGFIDEALAGAPLFATAEHYLHYMKAVQAGDDETARRIQQTAKPADAKALGRAVRGFDDARWTEVASQVAERAIYLKFSQNPAPLTYLLSTGQAELVEASPYDRRWGIGLTEAEAKTTTRDRWGENWLGKALARARLRLRLKVEPPIPCSVALQLCRSATNRGGNPGRNVVGVSHRSSLPGPSSQTAQPRKENEPHVGGGTAESGQQPVLSPAMRRLAAELLPTFRIKDCGGGGKCGNNSLAYLAAKEGVFQGDGDQLRRRVCDHARFLLGVNRVWDVGSATVPPVTVRNLLETALRTWAPPGMQVSAEKWVALMSQPRTWIDQGFMAMAADALQVEVRYYTVRGSERICTDALRPGGGRQPLACLRLALELEQHYCAIERVDESKSDATARDGAGALDDDAMPLGAALLVPTESQWQMLLEESAELAKETGMAAVSAEEFEELMAAVHLSERSTPPSTVALAMQRSLQDMRAEEARQLREAVRISTAEAGGTPLDEQATEEAGDSVQLTPAPSKTDQFAAAALAEQATVARGPDLVLDSDEESAMSSEDELEAPDEGQPIRGGDSRVQGRQPQVAQADGVSHGWVMGLHALTLDQIQATTVVVVPYAVTEVGEPAVLVPADDASMLAVHHEAGAGGAVEAAETGARTTLPSAGGAVGFAVGRQDNGARMVAVAVDTPRAPIARTAKSRLALIAKGATAIWCTLAALATPTWQMRTAGVAVTAASHFLAADGTTGPNIRTEHALREATGWQAGRSGYKAPARASLKEGRDVTARSLINDAQRSLGDLKAALWSVEGEHAEYNRLWGDAVKPLNLAEVSPELLDQPLGLADAALGAQLFSEPLPVYETPWLPRMPQQRFEERAGCKGFTANNALELLDGDAQRELRAWFRAAQKDMACLDARGPMCDRRDKPGTIAIGQDQFHPCARGYVWDCRAKPCRLLDHDGPISTDFDLEYLRDKLEGYPDQRLASNVLEGVRLEADLELIAVLSPHLVSIGDGYDSVQKTVRELRDQDFYDFFEALPFMPIVLVGQGSRIKKLGVKVYRRTSNFSGPHKEVRDKAGRKVVPINDASRCYLVPEWIANSPQAEVRRWAAHKYAHVPKAGVEEVYRRTGDFNRPAPSSRHKFPKERKPSLSAALGDAAVLTRASLIMGEPIFIFLEDAAFYFNQLGYAPEELWKSNLIINARPGDVARNGAQYQPGQVIFISEKRLGFGSFASSNIAQRFSNALTGWAMEEFDRLEEAARADAHDPAWEAWIAERKPLEATCRERRPKRKGEALSDCRQTRLAMLTMFTDDPIGASVGVARTLRLLEAWRRVTRGANVAMAGPEKRQLGGDVEWIGVYLLVAIGLVAIPKNKLLRAKDAVRRTLQGEITFGEYRALVGLLEHLRFVTQLQADATNALYHPHRRGGEREDGPSTYVQVTTLMRSALERWDGIILYCAGAATTIVFSDDAEARLRQARAVFAASSDAAGDGRGTPGIGGYLHGYYWRLALGPTVLALMHITGWETLAACLNILVAARLASSTALLALQVDALLTPYAISKQKSKSLDVQHMVGQLLRLDDYDRDIAGRLVLRHLSGDGNVPSDLTSRGLWQEFAELCTLLRVKPVLVRLDEREVALALSTIRAAAERRGSAFDPRELHAGLLAAPPRELEGTEAADRATETPARQAQAHGPVRRTRGRAGRTRTRWTQSAHRRAGELRRAQRGGRRALTPQDVHELGAGGRLGGAG